jgi:Holliday junction resolvase RusA-like endonuclease
VGKGSSVSFPARRGDGSIVTFKTKSGKTVPKMIHKGDDDRAGAWATSIAQSVGEAMAETGMAMIPKGVPVIIEMVFYRPRNQGDYGTGRNAGVLKASAPALPAVKPDVDKQVRLVLDALKTVAWHDDGQVVGAPAFKDFGSPARLELRIWRLAATLAERNGEVLEDGSPQDALFPEPAVV